jgi:tRNA U55 pseudouridine synthase TruB
MGCGAHLAALRRTVHGGFSLKNALVWPPEALLGPNSIEKEHEEYFRAKMPQFLIPLNGALAHLPAIALNDQQVPYIRQGRSLQSIWLGKLFGPVIPKTEHSDGVFKVLNDQEDLVALVTVDRGRDRLASIYPPRFKYLRVFN